MSDPPKLKQFLLTANWHFDAWDIDNAFRRMEQHFRNLRTQKDDLSHEIHQLPGDFIKIEIDKG